MIKMKRTVYIVSLGCAKNLVDSELILGALVSEHWRIVEDPNLASVVMVNTCGFIQSAVEESIEEILQLVDIKTRYPEKKLVVVGCLVQRYTSQLLETLPEVDLFIGTEGVSIIAQLLDELIVGPVTRRIEVPDRILLGSTSPRLLTTPPFRSWLKITEGCDNCCTYCLIPSIRGGLRSRSIEDLVCEAQILESKGVKELSLIAQDLTAFGMDNCSSPQLHLLVEKLLVGTTIPWLRLLYLHPAGIDERLLNLMAEFPRIMPYLDIPIQHVNNRILSAMNRRYTVEDLERLIDRIRASLPEIALRTTLLVGFPGETESDILQLEEFLLQYRFDHVGIFAYSNEEGCASENFPEQCSEEEKIARRDHLLHVQSGISAEKQKKYIGRIEPVLVEGMSSESDLLLEGRTRFQAPDVDGCVYIVDGVASPGDIVNVSITEAHVYDLVGVIAEDSSFDQDSGKV